MKNPIPIPAVIVLLLGVCMLALLPHWNSGSWLLNLGIVMWLPFVARATFNGYQRWRRKVSRYYWH